MRGETPYCTCYGSANKTLTIPSNSNRLHTQFMNVLIPSQFCGSAMQNSYKCNEMSC